MQGQQGLFHVQLQTRPAVLRLAPCHRKKCRVVLCATPKDSSEFEGVEGDELLQETLMQQLRVQIETETLKEEIKEDLKGKAEEMKQIGDEVCTAGGLDETTA